LQTNVHRLLDPREDPVGSRCLWFYQGVLWPVSQPVEVSHLLSYVFDKLFSDTPHIRNELIVRRSLSSAAAAARRNLVEAMLTRAGQPSLGIEGYRNRPVRRTGELHYQVFSRPPNNPCRNRLCSTLPNKSRTETPTIK
jgi:hypothetical protein